MKKTSLSQIFEEGVSHDKTIKKKVIAKKGDIPHIPQIAQAILKPGNRVKQHSHSDLYEVFYIESGEVQVKVNNQENTLKAGDIITIEPNDIHEFENKSEVDVKMFYFGIEITGQV